MNTAQIKQKANELSKLCLEDSEQFTEEFVELYSGGECTEDECEIIRQLCDLYIAIKQDYMSREDGAAEQKRILSGGKCE